MASLVDSQEVEVSELTHLTGSSAVNVPVDILSRVEIVLTGPFGGFGPGFSASPIADPILISGVDEDLNIVVVED